MLIFITIYEANRHVRNQWSNLLFHTITCAYIQDININLKILKSFSNFERVFSYNKTDIDQYKGDYEMKVIIFVTNNFN